MVFVFLHLITSPGMISSRSIHVAAMALVHSFFYGYIVFHYMYHIFINSSVDGHLGCLHVLTIVNSAAVNTGMHVTF